MKKGTKVMVYQDPVTCEKPEGEGVVTGGIVQELWKDSKGRQLYRCNVRFSGERQSYSREVSEIL